MRPTCVQMCSRRKTEFWETTYTLRAHCKESLRERVMANRHWSILLSHPMKFYKSNQFVWVKWKILMYKGIWVWFLLKAVVHIYFETKNTIPKTFPSLLQLTGTAQPRNGIPQKVFWQLLGFFFIRHRVPFSAIESPEAKDIFTPLLGKPPTDLTFRDICHETEKSLKDKVRVENTCLDPSWSCNMDC